jgi:hypothetical protein
MGCGSRSRSERRPAELDTDYVRTYTVDVNLTLSIDDEVVLKARRRAEAIGTSVNQLVREYLEQLAGKADPNADAEEFERLSRASQGDSRGWKFNREELHERK